ncbi:MAG: hypothetical protein IKN66_08490 [Ruminococcus sp.]|nr:hypothetical protein [Ruminococcus sp.]
MNKKITSFIASIAMLASFAGTFPTAHAESTATNGVDFSTDETTKDFIPPVFSQSPLGSCVACSTTYYQFTYEVRKLKYNNYLEAHKDDPDQEKVKEDAKKLIDFIYSPSDIYALINGGRNRGSNAGLAYSVLMNRGALTLDQYGYYPYRGIFFGENGAPKSIINIGYGIYLSLDEEEKKQYEKISGGFYKRIGEYITKDEYEQLSDIEKSWYIPVDFNDEYYRVEKLYRSVTRNEQDLFDALKVRIDGYEGCTPEYAKIDNNGNYEKRIGYNMYFEDDFINDIKGYLDEGKIVSSSAAFNYDTGMKPVVEVKDGKLEPTGEKAVAQNYYDLERDKKNPDNVGQGHQFTLVGYNDSITCDINENGVIDEGETGAFKMLNSHGTNFGNDGYVWVMYDAVRSCSALEQKPTVPAGFERRPAIENAYKIYVSEKDIKLVSEVDVLTNNFYDVAIDNSCDGNFIDTNGINNSSDPVVYSGPIFTDITELCGDGCGNGREFKICVNNRNTGNNTRIAVKSIKIKDDKGNIVASKQILADDEAASFYNRLAAGNYFENTISVNIAKGDLNYDGVYNNDDFAVVKAYFEKPEDSELSSFQLELLDVNGNGAPDEEDFAELSKDMA